MNSPIVSIIVPVFNVEKYLTCFVDSLLNQTLKEIEVILVDDGSPDQCPAICDEYAKQDPRIKVIHKKNAGQGYARNSGIEIAAGEYIAFVDSDDYLDLNTYQRAYALAKDTKTDAVYFTYQRFNDQGDTWNETNICEERHYDTKNDIRGLMLDMIANPPKAKNDLDIQCSTCCALYRHDVIKRYEVRYKSERELHSEDLLFNLDFLLHASNVLIIPEVFYNYRMNMSSFTRAIKDNRVDEELVYYRYLKNWLSANDFGHEGFLRATRHFIGESRSCIRQYVQSDLPEYDKKIWLKKIQDHHIWKEVAKSYPYWKLPLKYALHFYLLQKGLFKILYHFSTIGAKRH